MFFISFWLLSIKYVKLARLGPRLVSEPIINSGTFDLYTIFESYFWDADDPNT